MRPERATEAGKLAASANVSAGDLLDAAVLTERLRRDAGEWNANARALLELFALKLPYSAELRSAA